LFEGIKDLFRVKPENEEYEQKLGKKISSISLYNYTCIIDQ